MIEANDVDCKGQDTQVENRVDQIVRIFIGNVHSTIITSKLNRISSYLLIGPLISSTETQI